MIAESSILRFGAFIFIDSVLPDTEMFQIGKYGKFTASPKKTFMILRYLCAEF
jgi:hypothetical protein